MGFRVAKTWNGSGSAWVWVPTVTRRSCMAWSSAAWVFGGVRLISSARTRLWKMGPGKNRTTRRLAAPSASSWSTSVPVMSAGSKSGVNWTRPKERSRASPSDATRSVLASPGTPTSSAWPRAKSATSINSTTASWPTTRTAMASRSLAAASRAFSSSSTSLEAGTLVGEASMWGCGEKDSHASPRVSKRIEPQVAQANSRKLAQGMLDIASRESSRDVAARGRRPAGLRNRSRFVGGAGLGVLSRRGDGNRGWHRLARGDRSIAKVVRQGVPMSDLPRRRGPLALRRVLLAMLFAVLVYGGFAVWRGLGKMGEELHRFRWSAFAAACSLAFGNYLLRWLKWEFYLARLKIRGVGRVDSLLTFLSGFVLTVTPGKVGEVFKSIVLFETHGVAVARTAPIVVAERVTDVIGIVVLIMIGSIGFSGGLVWA